LPKWRSSMPERQALAANANKCRAACADLGLIDKSVVN
jgi:hypothetical protein